MPFAPVVGMSLFLGRILWRLSQWCLASALFCTLRASWSGSEPSSRAERCPFDPKCYLSRSGPGGSPEGPERKRRTAKPLTRLGCGGYPGLSRS